MIRHPHWIGEIWVDARNDHVAELADVVRGAGHQVADALAIVKGLTFPE